MFKKINSGYTIHKSDNAVTIIAESKEEEALINDIAQTVTNKINRLSKTNNVASTTPRSRDKNTLKLCCDKFIDFKSSAKTSQKTLIKYKQAVNYLYLYFGEKYLVKNIDKAQTQDFRIFLLKLPKQYKSIEELKDKNLRTLTESKKGMSYLAQWDKQELRTVDEIIVKTKSIFKHFQEYTYIYNNPFAGHKKLSKGTRTKEIAFEEEDLKSIFKHTTINKMNEDYNLMLCLLHTGLRRNEILSLKVKHINFEKGYIDTRGTKTEYALRIIPIHKNILDILREQIGTKTSDNFVFFNDMAHLAEDYRMEKIGANINKILKEVLGTEIKGKINIRSFRKNFAQILFLSDKFNDLNLKSLMGHSTKNDVTDIHYIQMKRDYAKLGELMQQVDFSDFYYL